jgi:uncharacterized protein
MFGGWSTTIDPIQLADKGARLTGEIPLKGMRRLVEMCRDERGTVIVDLHFERDPSDGLRVMRGRVDARVGLTCQRCMGRLDVELHTEPRLSLLKRGEREDLLETGDALLVEHPMPLGLLIEDELLLEMPMVPMHPADQCPAPRGAMVDEAKKKEAARPNPFSILEKLKHTDR